MVYARTCVNPRQSDMPELLDPPYPPFTAAQAAENGISRRRLRTLLDRREVRRVLRGVYQSTSSDDTLHSRARAAALVMSDQAVICDRTAAWIHGVDVLRYRELEFLPPLDLVVLRSFSRRERSGWRNGERDLAPHDFMLVAGLRVTTPLRTTLDLGCKLPRSHALAAVDAFMRLHMLSRRELEAELPRFRGRRGVVQLRSLLPVASPLAESPGESWVRMHLIDAGLPPPHLQYSVIVNGRELYRLDLAYPLHRICIEYDGVEFHTLDRDREADRERRDWLRARGWKVLVITKDDLEPAAVERWTAEVRALLTRPTRWPRG